MSDIFNDSSDELYHPGYSELVQKSRLSKFLKLRANEGIREQYFCWQSKIYDEVIKDLVKEGFTITEESYSELERCEYQIPKNTFTYKFIYRCKHCEP